MNTQKKGLHDRLTWGFCTKHLENINFKTKTQTDFPTIGSYFCYFSENFIQYSIFACWVFVGTQKKTERIWERIWVSAFCWHELHFIHREILHDYATEACYLQLNVFNVTKKNTRKPRPPQPSLTTNVLVILNRVNILHLLNHA